MSLNALLLCLLLFVLSFLFLKNKPLHPATLFFGMYSLILLFSHLNLYGMIAPSAEALSLIVLMLCSFAVGTLGSFFPDIHFKIKRNKKDRIKVHRLDLKLFYILTSIAILFLLYDIFVVVRHFLNGVPLWQVRNWSLSEYGADNPIMAERSFFEEFFRIVILSPVGMSIPPIAAYTFFDSKQKKHKKNIMIISLVHVLLTSIAGGGGRLRIVYFCGCFIIAYLLFSNRKQYYDFKKNKYKKYILIAVIMAVIATVLVTVIRLGGGLLWRQIYKYFALPPTLLSIWLPNIEDVTPTNGILSFYGIVGYIFRGLKMIGMDYMVPLTYDDAYQYILQAQKFRNVGYGLGNAYVTPIYYMYIDGGKTFICVVTFLLSAFASRCHKRIKKQADIRSFSIYAMVMYGVFETFMTIITAVPAHIITFIFIYALCRKYSYEG